MLHDHCIILLWPNVGLFCGDPSWSPEKGSYCLGQWYNDGHDGWCVLFRRDIMPITKMITIIFDGYNISFIESLLVMAMSPFPQINQSHRVVFERAAWASEIWRMCGLKVLGNQCSARCYAWPAALFINLDTFKAILTPKKIFTSLNRTLAGAQGTYNAVSHKLFREFSNPNSKQMCTQVLWLCVALVA